MLELFNKLIEGKNTTVILCMAAAIYAGKLQVDQLRLEIAEIKSDQKEITKFLAEHAVTWAKIAERVKIYHKDN